MSFIMNIYIYIRFGLSGAVCAVSCMILSTMNGIRRKHGKNKFIVYII